MTRTEIQNSIILAIHQMSEVQQLKLLEFIQSIITKPQPEPTNPFLQFAGYFPSETLNKMSLAIKDCEKIDQDEW